MNKIILKRTLTLSTNFKFMWHITILCILTMPTLLIQIHLCNFNRFYFRLNRLEDAVTVFTSALEVDIFFLDAYIGRGNAFMDYGHEITNQMARYKLDYIAVYWNLNEGCF